MQTLAERVRGCDAVRGPRSCPSVTSLSRNFRVFQPSSARRQEVTDNDVSRDVCSTSETRMKQYQRHPERPVSQVHDGTDLMCDGL